MYVSGELGWIALVSALGLALLVAATKWLPDRLRSWRMSHAYTIHYLEGNYPPLPGSRESETKTVGVGKHAALLRVKANSEQRVKQVTLHFGQKPRLEQPSRGAPLFTGFEAHDVGSASFFGDRPAGSGLGQIQGSYEPVNLKSKGDVLWYSIGLRATRAWDGHLVFTAYDGAGGSASGHARFRVEAGA